MQSSPRTRFDLFERQFQAIEDPRAELLVGSDEGRGGASHLLRVAAIYLAGAHPGARVGLVQRHAAELRRNHLEGGTGLFALVGELQRAGVVEITPAELRFANGSTVRWSGCARETEVARLVEQRIDVLLLDDLHAIPEPLYTRLRDLVLHGGGGPLRRIIAATRAPAEGWIGQHWNGSSPPERGFIRMGPEDLPPQLAAAAGRKAYRDHLLEVHGGALRLPRHIETVFSAIDRWMADEWQHIAIFMPSQHGKSFAGPQNAVPYLLLQDPTSWCAVTSYDTPKAADHAVEARDNYARAGGALAHGKNRERRWRTLAGGGCWAAGVNATQAGRTATYGFGDDLDKDWFDAIKKREQTKKRRWYGSTFRKRESMFADDFRRMKLCLTATRWDPEDTVGYALQQGALAGERWGLLVLSALYDPAVHDGYRKLYPSFDILPDFRTEPGEPIWEERMNREDWMAAKILSGPLIFDCESQQSPRGAEHGGIIKAAWLNRLDRDPAHSGREAREDVYLGSCRAWDLAATEGGGDHTAGAKLGRRATDVVMRHVVRAQLSPAGVRQLIACCMLLDGPEVKIRLPIDPAAGGEAAADAIVTYLREVAARTGTELPPITCERPSRAASQNATAKANRARPFASIAEPPARDIAGGVAIVTAPWTPSVSSAVPRYEEIVAGWPELRTIAERAALLAGDWWTPALVEMEAFTGADGREDDQVDAIVEAYAALAEPIRECLGWDRTPAAAAVAG